MPDAIRRHELAGPKPGSLIARAVRSLVGRSALRTFEFWPRLGVWILPRRYDDPVPEPERLDRAIGASSDLAGVDLRTEAQLGLLRRLAAACAHEWAALPRERPADPAAYFHDNPSYGRGDAEVTWAMVRSRKPRRIVEVGSGMSTRLLAAAALRNASEGSPVEYVVIDPYPGDVVRAGIPGVTELRRAPLQDQPDDTFTRLGRGDVCFIDSSHVVKTGSDVQHLVLDTLPKLAVGVAVHVHDVFWPDEYPERFLREQRWFWNEQYFIQAFLAYNASFEILWAAHYMLQAHPAEVESAMQGVGEHGEPSALWFERVS